MCVRAPDLQIWGVDFKKNQNLSKIHNLGGCAYCVHTCIAIYVYYVVEASNQFTGPIPAEITSLVQLTSLDLVTYFLISLLMSVS